MKQLIAILLLSLVLWSQSYASTQLGFPGAVPKDDSRPSASDLFYQGKILLPSEAKNLKTSGVDLSNVNPKESDVWKERVLPLDEAKFSFENGETLNYLSFVLSRGGNFRFSGIKEENGSKKIYNILLSKKVHNVLLRSALLKKMGYAVPEMKHLENVKVKFSSPFEKENFLGRLAEDTLGDTARWVKENEEDVLVLQDVLVMEAQQSIYNLAIGNIPAGVIQNRRVFNSLLVPFTLADIPESVNLMSWNGFSILSNNIRFDYEANEDFSPSFDDVKWMARKLGNLSREDFVEVVRFAHLPLVVEALVVEKLIARRNTLMLLSDLPYVMIPYNAQISQAPDLVEGKLIKENFEGYASRFAFGDPESPLSGSQILSFLKNKAMTFALSTLVSQVNKRFMPQSNLEQDIYDRQVKIAEENFAKFLETGKVESTPLQVWAVPHFSSNLILSRDIITGSYLGTDNLIQLADSFGVSVDLGVYLGTSGLPVPWQGNGNVRASFVRNYSHIKPIQSMKIKTPWKNMMVPWLMQSQGHIFDDLINAGQKYVEAQDLLDTQKDALAKINFEASVADNAQSLTEIISKLEYPVGLIATLVREQRFQRDEEKIEEARADYSAKIKNNEIQEVIASIRSLIEGLPNFNSDVFEGEKKTTLEGLTKRLSEIEALNNEDEKTQALVDFLPSWTSFRKRIASLQGEEESQAKMAFLAESKNSLELVKNNDDRSGLQELVSGLTIQISSVSKGIVDDRAQRMNHAFKTIKEELKVGESLVITDNIGASLDVNAAYSASQFLQLSGGVNGNYVTLSRLHIHRSSENTIQIYKDLGSLGGLGLRFGVNAGLPVVVLTGKLTKGEAKTKFYELDLGDKDVGQAGKVATALRALLADNSLELVQTVNKPFELTHHFDEKRSDLSLLVWDWSKLKSNDQLIVKHPEGSERLFYKVLSGRRFSLDFKSLFVDLGNLALKEANSDIKLQNKTSSDPSMSLFGRGVVRQLSFEAEGVAGKIAHPAATMNYTWKGWMMSAKKAQKIINGINERFGSELYMPDMLNDTTQLQLYSIVCNVYIYSQGLDNLAHFSKDKMEALLKTYSTNSYAEYDTEEQRIQSLVYYFARYQKKYLNALSEGNVEDSAHYGEKMISLIESNLTMKEIKLIAGKKNFLVTSRVQGFRKGDENGDRPLVSNTWGEIGDQYSQGPMTALKNFIGMTDSEFFGLWIMGRL